MLHPKKLIISIIFSMIVAIPLCQTRRSIHSVKEDQFSITPFSGGIRKITFIPRVNTYNEQVSNAVIAKPIGKSWIQKVALPKGFNLNITDPENPVIFLGISDSGLFKTLRFKLRENEKIFGTGERSLPLNRRGYKLNLYNNPWYGYSLNADNLNYSVPFIISSLGYAIFFDNPSRGYLDIGKANPSIIEYGSSSGEISFYLIPGKSIAEIMQKYENLVGTQPIPARWVFGNLMSRFGYRSEGQLMGIVDSMKQQRIPVDAVILDLFWFGDSIKGTMGNLDWTNHKAWPDPAKMIGSLKRKGINTVLITEPFVLTSTPNYEPSKKFHAVDTMGHPFLLTDFYFGNGGLIDIFRNDARDWFWSKYKKQISIGVSGWWGDLGEPEKHPSGLMHNLSDLGSRRLFKADEVHNIYGHYWDKMLFDKYAKEYPAVRLFNLNRSGYAGSPRYSIFPWSGDVSRSWAGLQAQLPLMTGMSMSGIPYIHADAGGFAGGEGDMELYIRWLQFAVFTPVFRPHGTAFGDLDPTVKNIPSEAALYPEPYRTIARNSILQRYKLLPYNYTLAYEQAKSGKLLVRPLFYYDQSDSNLFKADDEFMWGDAILVAPVLGPHLEERKLYLPSGTWYDLLTDAFQNGSKWITKKVDSTSIPVYVKGGSFIPMFESDSINNTSDYNGKSFSIKYYPSATQSIYTMYDDDGVTNNTLKNGSYDLIRFEGELNGNDVHIKISSLKRFRDVSRKIKILLPANMLMISNSAEKHYEEIYFTGKPFDIHIKVRTMSRLSS